MDYFRRASAKLIGYGGRRCPCCFDFRNARGKRGNPNKIARAVVKRMDRRDISEYINEYK